MKIGSISRYLASILFFFLSLIFLSGCQYFDKKSEKVILRTQLDSTKVQFQRLRQEHNRLLAEAGQAIEVGFEVQIGAFRHFKLDDYSESLISMKIRKAGDMNRYVLGSFTTLEEAKAFLKDIKMMGVEDAFIAGVVDGKRVSVKEAEEAAKSFYGEW
ncbi:MAG: SPOR domain-containing protein [Bacteroidia bacterium]|nr:SPOR domain-containing protein [Bacteroidia bacterium]